MELRVLVTGSRDWPHPEQVIDDLSALLKDSDVTVLRVVHGQCPTGADQAAHVFCTDFGSVTPFLGKDVIEEPHPAAWNTYGKKAGPLRNQEMVSLGADICLAYILNESKGASHCAKLAEEARITVIKRTIYSRLQPA